MPVAELVKGVARERLARALFWSVRRTGDLGAQLFSPDARRDPYPVYDRIRDAGPLYRSRFGWYTASHAVVERTLRNPRFGHAGYEQPHDLVSRLLAPRRDPQLVDPVGPESMIGMNPPDHTRLRGLVAKVFTPRAIERLRPRIETLSHDLLDEPARTGSVDLMADFAGVLPVLVICEVLGIPTSERARMKQWGGDIAAALDLSSSARAQRRANAAMRTLHRYFEDLFAQRRRAPGDDVLSSLLAVEEQGDRLTQRELLATCLLLLLAGFETTVNLIGNGTLALLAHPEQLGLLRERPDLVPNAVEEMLRYDSSVQVTSREAVDDVEVEGVRIRAGTFVVELLGGANRDPAVFADPARFDVTRANARSHLAFAAGPHHCLGASLARLEGEVAFRALLDRFPSLQLAAEPTRRPTFVLRGLATLPLRVGGGHATSRSYTGSASPTR